MVTKCMNCPLRKHDLFADMCTADIEVLQRFKAGERNVEAGTTILTEGSNSPQLYTALRGMGLRSKLLSNGRRQVVNFVLPGDFIGLQAGLMGEMGHSVEATTDMTLCVFDKRALKDFFRENPDRAYDLTWLASTEEHFLGDALAAVGQRTAVQAVAWALTRVFMRGKRLAMVIGNTMPLPFRQQDLADALGLSLVHTNKTLARLRERQLVRWMDGELRIPNLGDLARVAMIERLKLPERPLI